MNPAVYDTDSFRFFYMSNCGGSLRTTSFEVLMSRGLNLAEARRLVVEAAFNPVLDRLDDAGLRQEIGMYIKERLTDD